jgi:RimJ/RimL family protein N-acetyltransferase
VVIVDDALMNSAMLLRPVTVDDLPILFAQQCDPEASRMAAFPSREREAFFTHWRTKVLGNPNTVSRAILVTGHVAGHVGAWSDAETQDRMLGYWLGRDYWGRGIASAAVRAFLNVETNRPLTAHVAKHNLGSIRVLEKTGFVRIGEEQFPLFDGSVGEGLIYRLRDDRATRA